MSQPFFVNLWCRGFSRELVLLEMIAIFTIKSHAHLTMSETIRIDIWLWACRFYKTRSLAAAGCKAGKVKRDGKTLKPASTLKKGDRIEVPDHSGTFKRTIEVAELLDKRVNPSLAAGAYLDHTTEAERRLGVERAQTASSERKTRKEGDQGRLSKKKRREWAKSIRPFGDPAP